jgi:hypothetical protein
VRTSRQCIGDVPDRSAGNCGSHRLGASARGAFNVSKGADRRSSGQADLPGTCREMVMWDRQSLRSLLTLLAGVAAAVLVIALQPEPPSDIEPPQACSAGTAEPGQPSCRLASAGQFIR